MRNLPLFVCLISVLTSTSGYARRPSQKVLRDLEKASQNIIASAPKDNEACFSPDEPCAAKLIKFMETAKESLDIAIFDLTDRQVAQAIAKLSEKVKVRVIVNRRLVKDEGPSYDLLKESKAKMKVGKQRGIMHDKFTIVDGKRLETGSFNYTYAADHSNQENQVYLSTPSIVSRYIDRFEKMWDEGKSAERSKK